MWPLSTRCGQHDRSKMIINPPSGFVSILPDGPEGPTGPVAISNITSFLVNGGNGAFAHFIFAELNGTISASDIGTTAFIQATTPGASDTGLAINRPTTRLYAANGAAVGIKSSAALSHQ